MKTMKVALCAIAKDEDPYIKEWVNYYLRIGFDDIFIFQNFWRYKNNDIHAKNVHFMTFDVLCPQIKCYNQFIAEYHKEYDFCAFFDIDEFLWLENFKDIHLFLEEYRECPTLFIKWRWFGDSGIQKCDSDKSVLRRFIRCDSNLSFYGKHIINLNVLKDNVRFQDPHFIICRKGQNSGNIPKIYGIGKNNPVVCGAEIYHYSKTWDEYKNAHFMKTDVFFDVSIRKQDDINVIRRNFEERNKNDIENKNLMNFLNQE